MKIHSKKKFSSRLSHGAKLALAMLLCANTPAFAAGESGITTVERMATASNLGDYILVRATSAPTTLGCTTDGTWHFALDISSSWGKGAYAMLLEARASGRQLWLSGTGLCMGGIELIRSITIYD